ncbi:MAG: N-6 DNA methylase [bacterium]|nr:N-6 DNA methylase [bacterium]
MVNERKTEAIVRSHFSRFDDAVTIEEQASDSLQIKKLLAQASKRGEGQGFPEFLISMSSEPDLLIVVECKAERSRHQSESLNRPADYAVDGALHYASYLSKQFDVVAIGVSGEAEDQSRVSHYLHLKGRSRAEPAFGNQLLSPNEYIKGYYNDPDKFRQDYNSLTDYTRTLNDRLQVNKVAESNRALLISAVLIALERDSFRRAYASETNAVELARLIQRTVAAQMEEAQLGEGKLKVLNQKFGFLEHETALTSRVDELREIVGQIDREINSFIKNHEYRDVLGELYVEFLRYANKDKGLGIVLTPPHITELFADLAQVGKSSIVYDNCAGTGGFLISAMRRMMADAGGSLADEIDIKQRRLYGVEIQSDIFPLAVSNMFIHQDGKSNIELASCFDAGVVERIQAKRPTTGLLNPPYKSDKSKDEEELAYVLNNLSVLGSGGTCVAILPMQTALATSQKIIHLKEELMRWHTLEAVLSMPEQLFFNSNVSTVTCVMVFTAHQPHPAGKEVWLALAKDDGYAVEMHKGRTDPDERWPEIRDKWVERFINRSEISGFSVRRVLGPGDEWCAEPHIVRDASGLTESLFEEALRQFAAAMFAQGRLHGIDPAPMRPHLEYLQDREWQHFQIGEVFNVSLGPYTEKKLLADGTLPYITRTAVNNGTVEFGNHETVYEGNCLTVGAEGVVAFYQPCDFLKGNKINVIRHPNLNPCTGLFVAAVMDYSHKGIYNYGYALVMGRLKQSRIPLPVADGGGPDWEFMSRYMEQLPYSSNLDSLEAE